MSGYVSVNRNVSSRVRKVARDGADVTSGGRQFHTWGPATENARLPTVARRLFVDIVKSDFRVWVKFGDQVVQTTIHHYFQISC